MACKLDKPLKVLSRILEIWLWERELLHSISKYLCSLSSTLHALQIKKVSENFFWQIADLIRVKFTFQSQFKFMIKSFKYRKVKLYSPSKIRSGILSSWLMERLLQNSMKSVLPNVNENTSARDWRGGERVSLEVGWDYYSRGH